MSPSPFALAAHAWNAAFSRGAGYESTPVGRSIDRSLVRGYFIDFTSKTTAATTPARETVPATLVQRALGWWERRLTGEAGAEESFLAAAELLERRGEWVGRELRWRYDVAVPKYGLEPGWCSALAQGQAASVFVRLASLTGEERHASLARAAALPLLDPRSELVATTPHGPALEEAPTETPSLILNGWIYGLWGLWDVAVGLGDHSARAGFDAGLSCLRALLPRYDVGWWSRYSLYPHRLEDLAKPFYHRLHVDQLAALHRLTRDDGLADRARRWAAYDRPLGRARAVAHKAVFVAARGRTPATSRPPNRPAPAGAGRGML